MGVMNMQLGGKKNFLVALHCWRVNRHYPALAKLALRQITITIIERIKQVQKKNKTLSRSQTRLIVCAFYLL